jgi:hypothetical protein
VLAASPRRQEIPAALQHFAQDTRFMEFYRRDHPIYQQATESLRDLVTANLRVAWFDDFFGARPGATLNSLPERVTARCPGTARPSIIRPLRRSAERNSTTALTFTLLLVVQASGDIWVRALERDAPICPQIPHSRPPGAQGERRVGSRGPAPLRLMRR